MSNAVAITDEVTVKLTDKCELKAKILGLDKPFNVAVSKIEAQNLPHSKNEGAWIEEWANSDRLTLRF